MLVVSTSQVSICSDKPFSIILQINEPRLQWQISVIQSMFRIAPSRVKLGEYLGKIIGNIYKKPKSL